MTAPSTTSVPFEASEPSTSVTAPWETAVPTNVLLKTLKDELLSNSPWMLCLAQHPKPCKLLAHMKAIKMEDPAFQGDTAPTKYLTFSDSLSQKFVLMEPFV